MNIQMIKEFLALADRLNYQEAAEDMYISLSSLSKHISKLESELNVVLFDRSTHKVQLSEYGKMFYSYAKSISQTYDTCLLSLEKQRKRENNRITICYLPILSQYGLIESLSTFQNTNPDVYLEIIEDPHPLSLLNSEKCDFAFDAEYEPRKTDYNRYLCNIDCLTVVVPANHPFAQKESISVGELRNEKFVLSKKSIPQLVPYFTKLCREAGFEPNFIPYVSYDSAVVKFVKGGMGISVMNMNHIPSSEDNEICIIPLEPSSYFSIYMYYSDKTISSALTNCFLDYYKDRFHKI